MMSFGAKPDTASILVPDHTHWGNEGPLLARVSDGKGIPGWDNQYMHLKARALRTAALCFVCAALRSAGWLGGCLPGDGGSK